MELRVTNKFRLGRKVGSGSFGEILPQFMPPAQVLLFCPDAKALYFFPFTPGSSELLMDGWFAAGTHV
jgi:hypothetical protein